MATIQLLPVLLETINCANCGVIFAIPQSLEEELRKSHKSFFCPNGHSQYFAGQTEAEKLRIELKRKEQELSNQVQEKLNARNEIDKLNRKLNRVHNGTCPCCKRSFANLKAHMKTKHPELLPKH